jgi:phosphatidylserine/phosphatidylglycerophosphate/cardiolipin synthase-like enzyme
MTSSPVDILLGLNARANGELGRALSEGTLRFGYSTISLRPLVGMQAAEVGTALAELEKDGHSLASIALMCRILSLAQAERDAAIHGTQLNISGPDVPGVPIFNTQATVASLFSQAQQEVLLTSYVFHSAGDILRSLAEKHDANPDLRVRIILDLTHKRGPEKRPYAAVAPSFIQHFKEHQWAGERLPEIWDYREGFENTDAGVMHAKVIVVDRKTALVTSANFTEAAQDRNIEAGVLIQNAHFSGRLQSYFESLIEKQALKRVM